jgi:CRP-like cAMP-binding protein
MRRFVVLDVKSGATLIRPGDPGQGLYVVLQGTVGVLRSEDGHEVELASLHAGDVFGEISLLGDEPASATVTATQASSLLFLGSEYFARLLDAVPEVKVQLEALREERLMDTRISMASLEEDDDDAAGEEELEIEVLI